MTDFLDSTLLFAQMLGRIAEYLIPVILVVVLLAAGYVARGATRPRHTSAICRYCEHRDQADRAVCTACITRRA